ncbi:MAG TPA: hypothetical protein VEF06_13965 [Bryobacteraceae bacterium]|nr:hypothetical protein [Bryobacteraceae bacterium]
MNLAGWVPAQIEWTASGPVISWCWLGETPLTDPFYDNTIDRVIGTPFNRLFTHRTGIDALGRWHAESPGLEPSGLIFHMSRCGSTLVSRMLAALPDHLVVSEAGPLDGIAKAGRMDWLRWMVSALGHRRTGRESRYFIKFDSSTTLHLPLVRQAYPDVPWIFVYRDPVEVLASHMNDPSAAMMRGVIGRGGLDLPAGEVLAMTDAEYRARVLARLCETAVHELRQSGLPLNYVQLPDGVWGEVAAHFGIRLAEAEIGAMKTVAQFHAKHPKSRFQPDEECKRSGIAPEARKAAERLVRPLYNDLETLRLRRSAGVP